MATRAGMVLLEARLAAGLTQPELADRAGLPRSAISMYERGSREPGADTFLRLLTATGAAVTAGRVDRGIDCWRNSEVFGSLASVLDAGVPLAEPGELDFPHQVWRQPDAVVR